MKARFLTDLSGGEKTAEEVNNPGCPPLYVNNLFLPESGTEDGDDTDSGTSRLPQQTATSSKQKEGQLPELSGRSRALLKTYFEEVNAFKLPPGQPVVAFTETQAYHLFRILTDETLRTSYHTMERMVTDAVNSTPTTAPSRTDHFRIISRAATPFRHADSDSSDFECSVPPSARTNTSETTDQGELGDSSAFEEKDSAEEMALISLSFKPLAETLAPILTASTSSTRDVGTAG